MSYSKIWAMFMISFSETRDSWAASKSELRIRPAAMTIRCSSGSSTTLASKAGVVTLNFESGADVEFAIQLQNRAAIVADLQNIARAEHAQVLARHVQLQDFGQVDHAEAGVPEQAVQRVAGLDLEHAVLRSDPPAAAPLRAAAGAGRGGCHGGCAEGFGNLGGELIAR